MGAIAAQGTHNAIHVLYSQVFNITLGANPAMLSLISFVQRFWDALLDPLVGHASDNLRSRWGRRRALLALAAIPLAVFFIAIWWVPQGINEQGIISWLLVTSLLFYSAHSLFATPLVALQIETAQDYNERTRLAARVQAAPFLFAFLTPWLFPLAQQAFFGGVMNGVRITTTVLGGIFLLCALAPVWLNRERSEVQNVSSQPRLSLRSALKTVGHNRPFWLLVGVRTVCSLGFAMVAIFGPYLNYYLMYDGDIRAGSVMLAWASTAYQIASVLSVFAFQRIAIWRSKRFALQCAASLLILNGFVKLLIYQFDQPWLQLIVYSLNGAALAGLGVLSLSMLGDVIDYSESHTGTRREGIYASLLSWFDKVGNSSGTLLSGFFLVWTGFNAKLGGDQAAWTLRAMLVLYASLPVAGGLAAIFIARAYPLDEASVLAIRKKIERPKA